MLSRILKTKVSTIQIALLLALGLMPVLVVGQNNDDKSKDRPRENKDRPRERPAPKAAPTRPAQPPPQQRQAAPSSPNAENPNRTRPERSTPPAVGQQQSNPQSNPDDRRGRREGSDQQNQRNDRNQRNAKDAGKQGNQNNNAGNTGGQPGGTQTNRPGGPDRRNQDARQNGGGNPSNVAGRRSPDNQPRTFRPPSNASTTARNDGGAVHRTPDGRQWETNRSGQVTHFSNGNTDVRLRDNGRITTVRVTRPDRTRVVVDRSVHGERRVEVVRTDRTRIVSYGARVGFVERPYRTGFVSRTYVYSGRPVAYVYRTHIYRGVTFYHYVPPVYYSPVFYGWAWNPWARPVVFSWGWRSDPWYGYYGSYFVPAPAYPTAALWLTDFLLAENLRLAYEQRQAAVAADSYYDDPGAASYTQTSDGTLSPEVKQAIAEEVRAQISEMQNSAGQPNAGNNQAANIQDDTAAPEALDPKQRIFVVSMNLDVNSGGRDCALTPGDIILRSGDALNGSKVAITVLNSKAGDCAVNSNAEIEAADLQEMHNQFREKIDSGLAQLASNQGKDGLPSSPAPAPRKVEAGTADADRDAARLLEQQQRDAQDLEEQARQNALDGK